MKKEIDSGTEVTEKREEEHRQRVENLRATRQFFDTLILREQPDLDWLDEYSVKKGCHVHMVAAAA